MQFVSMDFMVDDSDDPVTPEEAITACTRYMAGYNRVPNQEVEVHRTGEDNPNVTVRVTMTMQRAGDSPAPLPEEG